MCSVKPIPLGVSRSIEPVFLRLITEIDGQVSVLLECAFIGLPGPVFELPKRGLLRSCLVARLHAC